MVAASGQLGGRRELEAMGSRLLVALEQADRMTHQTSRSMSVDLGDQVLTAIRLRTSDGFAVTMAFLTAAALSETARAAVYQLLPNAAPAPSTAPTAR